MNRLTRMAWLLCLLGIGSWVQAQAAPPARAGGESDGSRQTGQAKGVEALELPSAPVPADAGRDPWLRKGNRILSLPKSLVQDQFGLWTSPGKARLTDATWIVPLAGLSAAFFATDSDFSRHLSNDPSTLTRYRHASDYGLYSMAAGAGGLYLVGLLSHNQRESESGFLGGEAAIDSVVIVEALNLVTRRQRPIQGNGNGEFWKGGDSFPSDHAAVAWSIASMMAHEYPSPLVRFLSYGAATGVSLSRIMAKQHFPSDVLVGSALGYLVSEYVYSRRHNPDVRGGAWEMQAIRPESPKRWQAKSMGSPYVPLDSWIYPAIERLAALGYINSGIAAMRPWTRMECARQVVEAGDRIGGDESEGVEAARLYTELQNEFGNEAELLDGGNNAEFRLESAYTRSTEIVGKPLTDGYHFGQTVFNDFGRPEEQGFNNVSGLSGWAADGPFVGYVRTEYQHAPSAPALPATAREAISQADFSHSIAPPPFPVPPDTPTASIDQAHLLDGYVAMNFSDWQVSYGKQSLWWGPDEGGSMMLGDNADPLRMFRVDRVTPFKLPGFLGVLGAIRMEFFLGQYSGYEFMFTPSGLVGQYGQFLQPQPVVHGERISFKLTPNFEVGLSRTTDYGGPGYPLTWHNFARSLFSTGNAIPGAPNKPGSRRSGVDFSYRIRNAATLYADGFTEHDEISPVVGPDVAAWLGGIYLPRLPKLAKMDLRIEGVETDPPIGGNVSSGFFYYDPTWISGFTNAGQLIGHWVGREGQGVQAWTTYWIGPRSKLQFSFRHLKVSHEFIPQGGTLADAGVRADLWAKSNFNLSAGVQYERWTYPVISPTGQRNVTSSLQLSFWPKGSRRGTQE